MNKLKVLYLDLTSNPLEMYRLCLKVTSNPIKIYQIKLTLIGTMAKYIINPGEG